MKTKIYLRSAILFLFCLSLNSKSFSQPLYGDFIYLHFPFTGNCEDWSGFDLHALCANVTPALGYNGEENGAFSHNGANSVIQRPYLDLDDSITFSLWYYSKSDSQNTALVYNGNSEFNGYGLFMKEPLTGRGLGNKIVVVQGGVAENTFNGLYEVPLEQWINIVMIKKGNLFELYIDGDFKASASRNYNPPSTAFSVGATPDQYLNGYGGFNGIIDEVKVYKKGFTATMVANLHQSDITSNKEFQTKADLFSISPNPATGQVNILAKNGSFQEVSIVNSLGQTVQQHGLSHASILEIETLKLDVSGLKPGVYSVVAKGKMKAQKKLVIQ